jgi:hypothetical protein
MMSLSPSTFSGPSVKLCPATLVPAISRIASQSAAEAQRRAMADELQRARLSLREEEALIERKRAALNADIERAQRAQSELIKTTMQINRLSPGEMHLLTPVERSQFGF